MAKKEFYLILDKKRHSIETVAETWTMKLCGTEITVIITPDLVPLNLIGYTQFNEGWIFIDASLSEAVALPVLYHELFEFVKVIYDLNLPHQALSAIAIESINIHKAMPTIPLFNRSTRSNPDLIEKGLRQQADEQLPLDLKEPGPHQEGDCDFPRHAGESEVARDEPPETEAFSPEAEGRS